VNPWRFTNLRLRIPALGQWFPNVWVTTQTRVTQGQKMGHGEAIPN